MNNVKRCPHCNKIAVGEDEIVQIFGYRKTGKYINVQSWCRKCRNEARNIRRKKNKC